MWPFNLLTESAQVAILAAFCAIIGGVVGALFTHWLERRNYKYKLEQDKITKAKERLFITSATWSDVEKETKHQSFRYFLNPIGPPLRPTMRKVDLSGAHLYKSDLHDADLTGTDLTDADLTEANLSGAILWGADLSEANLTGANLRVAMLLGADLSEANLTGANLHGAYLHEANLTGANLTGANLSRAYLRAAVGLTDEQINSVESLENAIMPDGTKFLKDKAPITSGPDRGTKEQDHNN